jgi:hypothetical protein
MSAVELTTRASLSNFQITPTFGASVTRLQLVQQPYIVNGSEIYLQDNWPDISQKNFFKINL